MKNFKVFSSPKEAYTQMLNDILKAKDSIYLETYIYTKDKIGDKFKEALIQKASQGIKVYLLMDAWGTRIKKSYFKKLEEAGGKVGFFKEFSYVIKIFSKNHERNHRKLLIIDNKITYIGSMNITEECLDWREIVLRLDGPITQHFSESFKKSWESCGKISVNKIKSIIHQGFEIIEDIPTDFSKLTESKYAKLINNAKKQILIETPYFIPPLRLRRALYKAVKRRIEVKILLPHKSDIGLMDIMRNRYLGSLSKAGVKIYYYLPKILHSKLILVDDQFFLLGSSNLDYRSFIHDNEINLFGRDKNIIDSLTKFYEQGIKESEPFVYSEWKSRSSFNKILELIFSAVENYL